jgi:16S rRNA (adenine(1408)-N(1))-methyltransferase
VARARTDTFVIGIDPATDALVYAARRVARQRPSNVVLLVASVESLPCELEGIADEVRVHFPWGSLLRGVLAEDDAVLSALARLPRAGGSLTVLLSVVPRDGVGAELGQARLSRISCEYQERGLRIRETRPLTTADVRESGASWGKRLGAGGSRPGLYIHAIRVPL